MDKSVLTLERHAKWLLLHLERCFASLEVFFEEYVSVCMCEPCRAFTKSGSNCRGEGIAGSLSPVYLRVAEWRGHQGSERVSQMFILEALAHWGRVMFEEKMVSVVSLLNWAAELSSLLHPCTKYIFTTPVSGATLALVRWCLRGTYLVSQMFSVRCYVVRCLTHLFIFVNSK